MRYDYQSYFEKLKTEIAKLNYKEIREGELVAEFTLASGWEINFECERYYGPAFTIWINPPRSKESSVKKSFAVWLLMRVFSEKTGKDYGKPSIENQARFMVEESPKIFDDIDFYKDEYSKLNSA